MSSTFEFNELKDVAKKVRFKDGKKKLEFGVLMEKLEKAILNGDKKNYDAAIKDLKERTKNKSLGFHFKEFTEKLEQLISKVSTKGAYFSRILIKPNLDEGEDIDERKQSGNSETASSRLRVQKQKEAKEERQSEPNSSSDRRAKKLTEKKDEQHHETSSKANDTEVAECREEMDKLILKLQKTCKVNSLAEITSKIPSYGGAMMKKKTIRQQFETVNEQMNRIIDHLDMLRGNSGVKGRAQEKQVKNVSENIEREAKKKMNMVVDLLQKLKTQIDSDKADVQAFQKVKAEGQEENQIKSCVVDICVKVENMREINKSLSEENKQNADELKQQKEAIEETWKEEFSDKKTEQNNAISSLLDIKNKLKERKRHINELTNFQETIKSEIASLKNDIDHFGDSDEPSIRKNSKEEPEIVKDIRNIRQQLTEKKKEIAKGLANGKSDQRGAKVQQQVGVLWKVAFCSDFDKKQQKGKDNVLQNMLEEITQEITKLKDLQAKLKTEIQSLKNDVENFDDPVELHLSRYNSEQPEILSDIVNVRKQLNIKKQEVRKVVKDRETHNNKGMIELKQQVFSLWKEACGTGINPMQDHDDHSLVSGLVKMLGEIKSEIRKLENVSFEVEGSSRQIHEKLFCKPPPQKDEKELNTCTTVLQNTFETLKSCADETKGLAENFSKLANEMEMENRQATLSLKCNDMRENITRWRSESKSMKELLSKASDLLPITYSELIVEPYLLSEPVVDFSKIKERFPEWLHQAAMSIKQIHSCIQSNKKSFSERFTETESIFKCLFQMYKAQTNEEYHDSWDENSRRQQKGKEKSSRTHVTFVIEDICKRLCQRSEDSVTQRYQKQITKLQDITQALEEEKVTLLTRLSKFAGANLTDNNPNIADLSDPRRPTKLAEDYSELYDNEWTNAFEDLAKYKSSENEVHSTLHDIIMEMFRVCADLSKKQDSSLKTVLVSPTTLTEFQSSEDVTSKTQGEKARASGSKKQGKRKETDEKNTISTVHSKAISELRKQTADTSFKSILNFIKTQQKYISWFKSEPLEEYTVRCIKLCWWMNVQSPPVYVDQDEVKDGSAFDTTKFKPYTKAGKKVAFVVWPALYLHQGGPILSKGIAQGK